MEVFRICSQEFSAKLTASGKSARWSKDNQFVLYTSQSRSLSTLELVAHRNSVVPTLIYKVVVISIPDSMTFFTTIKEKDLPKNWQSLTIYPELQNVGSIWYENRRSLILKVPSVIIPKEFNYIINTNHPDFLKNVSIIKVEDYFWDDRLL